MPTLFWLIVVVALSTGCEQTSDLPLPTAPTPPAVATLTIVGPNRLEVTEQARFDVTFVDERGVARVPTLTTWSSSNAGVLTVDRFSGAATAVKTGQATIVVSVESVSRQLFVTVTPKIALEIEDLPDEIDVGESGDVELVLVADFGDGEVGVPLSGIAALFPGASNSVQWSTPQPSIISVNGSVVRDTFAIVRGLAPGTAVVRVAVAGLTAEARTKVVAPFVPVIQVPIMPPSPPVSVTPQSLNGQFNFDLTRGAADCGLGLRERLNGTFEVDGVPASGAGGRARLDYGTAYNWVQLMVAVGSATILDFESEAIAAPIPGYQVFVSGRMLVQDRTGTLRFIWVRMGQPRSDSCAVFEGQIRRP